MPKILQSTWQVYPDVGFPGQIAEPNAPHLMDIGRIHVPSNARNPRPGDAVYYDTGEDAFALPTTAAQQLLVCGILSYPAQMIARAGSAIVEYVDDDDGHVVRVGSVWVVAGGAVEYNGLIQQHAVTSPDWQWDALTIPGDFASLVDHPIYCGSIGGATAAGNIIKARIGYGRIK